MTGFAVVPGTASDRSGSALRRTDVGRRESVESTVLDVVAAPELAFLLVAVGLVATAVWAAHPAQVPVAVVGVLVLSSGVLVLTRLPPSPVAVLLLALAGGSLALELFHLPGFALHAVGGALSLALAGLSLLEPWSGAHPGVVLPSAVVCGVATWWAARRSWRARRADPFDACERLVGRDVVVLDVVVGGRGYAVVAGEVWAIHDPDRPLLNGAPARVTGRDDDVLTVRQASRAHVRR